MNYCSFYCRCVFCLVSSLRGFDVFITSRGSFVKRGEREEQPPGRYPQRYRHTKIRLWEELAAAVWTSHCAALQGNLKAPADSFSELLFFFFSGPLRQELHFKSIFFGDVQNKPNRRYSSYFVNKRLLLQIHFAC